MESPSDLEQVRESIKEAEFSYYAYVSGFGGQGPMFFLMKSKDRFSMIDTMKQNNVAVMFIEELTKEQFDSLNSKIVRLG